MKVVAPILRYSLAWMIGKKLRGGSMIRRFMLVVFLCALAVLPQESSAQVVPLPGNFSWCMPGSSFCFTPLQLSFTENLNVMADFWDRDVFLRGDFAGLPSSHDWFSFRTLNPQLPAAGSFGCLNTFLGTPSGNDSVWCTNQGGVSPSPGEMLPPLTQASLGNFTRMQLRQSNSGPPTSLDLQCSLGAPQAGIRPCDVVAVPEPATWFMMATGMFALGFMAWRRKDEEFAI